MPGSVVPLGSVVFALIDPSPGHEVAFNRWYERDHYYTAGTAAPGVFSANHFIAAGEPAHVHRPHLALYFVLPDHDEARVAFASEQVVGAGQQDRLFTERIHLHTWTYRPAFTWHAEGHEVPTALALDHPYGSVSIALVDTTDDDRLAATARAAADGTAIAQVLGLAAEAEVMASDWLGPVDSLTRRALVFFHPVGPEAARVAVAAVMDRVVEGDAATLVWESSFHPAVFGTDAHVFGSD